MARKIAFIGAGSFGFTRALVRDILTFPALADSTIALMDVDSERLAYGDKKLNNKNDWKQDGHTVMVEDNVEFDSKGNPTYGEAGYAHLCRDAARANDAGNMVSSHGWIEIDHIPYVDRLQWAWSSSAWGRGVKCDIKIGDQEWKPLVWMGSNRQKNGYTVYSDQGWKLRHPETES